ncbi:hypothetical protein HF086_010347 [Spodoptera exigua]|uniref:Uncharacterized protein n=1 Tax=Spodoptera exigua TaxID=7107 RepID=A0A922SID1_SPOEX|nr:hypothetical protein HF086_010347 [Spodoptera exigua]
MKSLLDSTSGLRAPATSPGSEVLAAGKLARQCPELRLPTPACRAPVCVRDLALLRVRAPLCACMTRLRVWRTGEPGPTSSQLVPVLSIPLLQ